MAITFEDLQKANHEIRTTNIKGKEYAEVNQRIKAFRMVYPTGFIKTEIVRLVDGLCVFMATCGYYVQRDDAPDDYDDEFILATGHAYEKEGSNFINSTSFIENAETSAIGRCLGMAGFGIDTSVCSAEELGNAIAQQEATTPITEEQIRKINALAKAKGSDIKEICKYFKVGSLNNMTASDYGKCMAMLNAKGDKNEEVK